MKVDFESILPLACEWARIQEKIILEKGRPLLPRFINDANRVGVVHPDRVRTLLVGQIPVPEEPVLRAACEQTQLITKLTAGLTLRYGIFIRSDCAGDRRLHVHEYAHVAQYERLGGLEQFLRKYLHEVTTIGYPQAPMEQEAIKAESLIARWK